MLRNLIIFTFILSGIIFAAPLKNYQYISPKPGSDFNTRETTIIIRAGDLIDASSINEPDLIRVIGEKSGPVSGRLILSTDGKTVIFKPDQLFEPGDNVNVIIGKGLKTRDGERVSGTDFSFKVAPFLKTPNPYEVVEELRPHHSVAKKSKSVVQADTPENFPGLTATIYDTTDLSKIGDGYTFLAVATEVEGIGYYLMVLDNYGTPVWYKELADDYAYDFKVQPNGMMTYAHFFEHHSYTGGGNVTHMIMDTSFALVDSVQMQNGYVAEAHDFQLLPNGHTLMFGYYLTQVDMSQYVNGGYPAAMVSGGIIQEQDADRNVIFQWRSWDYYDFADYPWGRRSSGQTVSAFHLNTINLDNDGHIFLATPLWTKKINRQSGEIIWHLGGDGENEFSFTNIDSTTAVTHFGGHGFYRLPNDNVLIYDNGNRQGTSSSKAHEYSIDEENKTATHVWTYEPESPIYAWHRGNAQRLENGNTVIGWGGATGQRIPSMTEVNAAGEKIFEIAFDDSLVESYRAFRFPLSNKAKPIRVMITELADGNTYEFEEGDSLFTGVTVEIETTSPGGYNEMTVERWPYAPLYPQFPGKSPRVMPVRVYTSGYNINSISAEIFFDAESFGFTNPDTLIIYHREFPGQGLFIPLATTYNPVTGMLSAPMTRMGEFIFAIPDLEEAVYSPILSVPASQDSTVNQELPVNFFWSPRGLFNSSHLQVATDPEFTTLVVNDSNLTETRFVMDEALDSTRYYWRVRIKNQAGTGGWSDDWFQTMAPIIVVDTPNGGEEWQRGLSYFIFWNDNIVEDVVLELFKGENSVGVIDTTTSNGAYEWDIDFELATGIDYSIKIQSLDSEVLFDMSNASFSVIDTVTSSIDDDVSKINTFALHQNYPNPFNPSTIISYQLPEVSDVELSIYNLLGQRVITLSRENQEVGQHQYEWNATNMPTGIYYYRIQAGKFQDVKKMVLIK